MNLAKQKAAVRTSNGLGSSAYPPPGPGYYQIRSSETTLPDAVPERMASLQL